jgi:hypothetical protein
VDRGRRAFRGSPAPRFESDRRVVALYTDRRLDLLRTPLEGERIHRAAEIPVTVFPQAFLRELEAQARAQRCAGTSRSATGTCT